MTENLPLTVCVITLNEEANIERCLNSVQWADELLVVDSGSEDRTVELAEACGARTMYNKWPGHVEQKQYATDQAKHDWILSIDADEKVSTELKQSIFEQFKNEKPSPEQCFQINRLSNYLGTWLLHGSWHPDYIVRLFHRKETSWGGSNPHDKVQPTEKVSRLQGVLYHYPYEDLTDHLNYINNYTDIMAQEKDQKDEKGTITRAITHSIFKLFKEMILKLGFLDGKTGIIAAGMSTWYVFLKYAKLWELQNVNTEEKEPN